MQPLGFRRLTIPTVKFIQQNCAWFQAANVEVPKFFHAGTHMGAGCMTGTYSKLLIVLEQKGGEQ
jgi:hypothetical protein